jgi:glyoxylase-like metal-dependent hydrolase (beta-lactamase superfamily II)
MTVGEPAPGGFDVERIVAPNPGPMTLEGTNTYLVGSGPCLVIDPGPADASHLETVAVAAERRGGAVAVILTHRHGDHAAGAEELGVPVVLPEEGDDLPGGLRVLATPGHAPEHVCLLAAGGLCFSGDLVLGSGSTFVPPEGEALISFLASLERLLSEELAVICPGHGPWVTEPHAKVREYIEHKQMRERRLLAALRRGERSRGALLDEVWDDAPPELRQAAEAVMAAHLEKLRIEGLLDAELTD